MEIYNAIIKLQKGDKTDDSAQVSPPSLSLSHSLSLSLSHSIYVVGLQVHSLAWIHLFNYDGNLFAGLGLKIFTGLKVDTVV
jgi:hypothetical protein